MKIILADRSEQECDKSQLERFWSDARLQRTNSARLPRAHTSEQLCVCGLFFRAVPTLFKVVGLETWGQTSDWTSGARLHRTGGRGPEKGPSGWWSRRKTKLAPGALHLRPARRAQVCRVELKLNAHTKGARRRASHSASWRTRPMNLKVQSSASISSAQSRRRRARCSLSRPRDRSNETPLYGSRLGRIHVACWTGPKGRSYFVSPLACSRLPDCQSSSSSLADETSDWACCWNARALISSWPRSLSCLLLLDRFANDLYSCARTAAKRRLRPLSWLLPVVRSLRGPLTASAKGPLAIVRPAAR